MAKKDKKTKVTEEQIDTVGEVEAKPAELDASDKTESAVAEIEGAEEAEAPIKTEAEGKKKKNKFQDKDKRHIRGKNYTTAKKTIHKDRLYKVAEAIEHIKKSSYAKFNESIEIHINLGVDAKNNEQRIRFTTTLPNGSGKSVKILVISEDNSGQKDNVLFRDESAVAEILNGKISMDKDFNVVVSTSAKMKDLAKVARILGPKGLMPSPKFGTVTDDVEKAIQNLSKGQIEVRSQPSHAVIHQVVGKINFETKKLEENIEHLISEINRNTPPKIKSRLVQKVYLASTMGPSIRVNL